MDANMAHLRHVLHSWGEQSDLIAHRSLVYILDGEYEMGSEHDKTRLSCRELNGRNCRVLAKVEEACNDTSSYACFAQPVKARGNASEPGFPIHDVTEDERTVDYKLNHISDLDGTEPFDYMEVHWYRATSSKMVHRSTHS